MTSETDVAEALLEHRQRLWRLVHFRMHPALRGRVDAEDILQDAYLDAVARRGQFPRDGSHYLWLRLIVLQTLVDHFRRHVLAEKRSVTRETKNPPPAAENSTSLSIVGQLLGHLTSPSQAILREELGQSLREAIDQMGEIDAEVLALRHFEELSNQEIAAILGITEKAASIRYVRALQRLKDLLPKIPGFSPDDFPRSSL